MMTITRRAALGAMGLAAAPAAWAQTDFPGRPVTMVVAFPPGGQADVVARPVAASLERQWRVAVPVQNRPGAAGEIGNASVARAAPDGLTVLMALSSVVVLPEAAKLFNRAPAYTLDQLKPLALVTADPVLLAVPAASPWQSLEQFLTDARRRPGVIPYSSSGNYSALHLPMAMLATAANVDLLHVPFQGGGPALTALLAGQVQAMASGPGPIAPHVRDGRLRVLASWGANPIAGFEQVPTLLSKGFVGVEYYIWCGAYAPAATPEPVAASLRAAFAAAAQDPDVVRALTAAGSAIDFREGEAFAQFAQADAVRLAAVVQRIGRID